MGTILFGWVVASAVLVAYLVVVFSLWSERGRPAGAPPHPCLPGATVRLLFLSGTEHEVVIDGLVHLERSADGIPSTWVLRLSGDPLRCGVVLDVLERWVDDETEVDLDLSSATGRHPSIAFADHTSLVRMSVVGPAPLSGDGRVSHP